MANKILANPCILAKIFRYTVRYNALTAVSATVLYTNYSTRGAFKLPTQSGTLVFNVPYGERAINSSVSIHSIMY